MHLKNSAAAAALLCAVGVTVQVPAAVAVDVLDYCLEHRDQCAISVSHVTEDWERHLNPDRLQVTASTFKILTLIVYAQAVVDGKLDPERTITKEEWARFWVGRDGEALARSWEQLGRPDRVRIDEIVRKMIEESDNAAPDWLLNELGASYFKKALRKHLSGYHDLPASIGAMFTTWLGSPDELEMGSRILESYSGFDAFGYGKEAAGVFKRLRDPDFTREARRLSCSVSPWETPDPSCREVQVGLGSNQIRQLLGGFFLQSNTRTYNRLLLGILNESLLPEPVQRVVVRHLEWQLEIPEASDLATRLGSKGGSLAPQNVCNYVIYAQLRDTGEEVVVSVFLQDVPVDLSCDDDIRPFELAEAVLLEPGFKQELMKRLPAETPRPDLIARFETLKRKTKAKGDQLKTRIRLRNIGIADAEGPFEIWLVLSDDARVNGKDTVLDKWVIPFLAAGDDRALRFKRKRLDDLEGKFLFLRVDRKGEIDESGEDNDRPWQILR